MEQKIIRITCNAAEHAAGILDIFNEVIANSTALYEFAPRTMEDMHRWFRDKNERGHPVIGRVDEAGRLLGFAGYGPFRDKAACHLTVEHSLYIHHTARGRGMGTLLLRDIIDEAGSRSCHTLVGAIDAANEASIKLHVQAGFVHAGTIRHAAYKFGRWLDLVYYQLILNPQAPAPQS